ncbi:hypothetical protein F652_1161 [Enterobacteriaceae bacterium bta3-1]|nr:hypothetical protein F652_1161 [Enterobacteriaceae bacterium bta3-1]
MAIKKLVNLIISAVFINGMMAFCWFNHRFHGVYIDNP